MAGTFVLIERRVGDFGYIELGASFQRDTMILIWLHDEGIG